MLYFFYHLLTRCSGTALHALTRARLQKGKEDPARISERFGDATLPRPMGKLIWCHGSSVGESLSILPLLNSLQARLPDWQFLVTTNTLGSARLMRERLPDGMLHQFIPWDHPQSVKKFLDHWQPDAVLWLESELWPNLLAQIKERQIPAALLNARMRPRSARKWRLARGLLSRMLSSFRIILVGSREARPLFESFGAGHVRFCGSLKFGAKALPVAAETLQQLRQAIGTRPRIAFLQTHADEEDFFVATAQQLHAQFPDLLILIAPRQPNRGTVFAQKLRAAGLNVSVRSVHEALTPATTIYLADTLGEMGVWYSLCPLAVIGGSFIPHGGQNPIEGTHFGTAVLYGPHMFNFVELCLALEETGAGKKLTTQQDLLPCLIHLLTDIPAREKMQQAARDLASQNVTVIDAFADAIMTHIIGETK